MMPVEPGVQQRVGMLGQGVGRGLDGLEDVGVVVAQSLEGAVLELAGHGEIVDPPGVLAFLQGERDGDRAVGFKARLPETRRQLHRGERDRHDGVVRAGACSGRGKDQGDGQHQHWSHVRSG